MFAACGVAAFAAGIFHLMTHAFFKALLFLGAGSVIHALSGQQDIRNMGGLKKYLPVTFLTFLAGTLAISGIPGFSGFFSKDEILWKAFSSGHGSPWLWLVGLVTAMLTAFYMFRLVFLTFYGRERIEGRDGIHVHESPRIMTIPLGILAVLSVIGGYIGIPHVLGGGNTFEKFLDPVMKGESVAEGSRAVSTAALSNGTMDMILMLVSTALILLSIYLAYRFYMKRPEIATRLRRALDSIYRLLYGKYYVDEAYQALIVRPLIIGSTFLWKIFDMVIIDGLINGLAVALGEFSIGLRTVQTGSIRTYTAVFVIGVILLIGFIVIR